MFPGKTKLGGQMLADMIAVKKRNRPAANFEKLDHQNVRNSRFAGTGATDETAALTRAEIRKLMKEKDSADAIETMPTAAD